MSSYFSRMMAVALVLVPLSVAEAGDVGGIGIIGDSYSDEYQFYPPDRAMARNWMEILAETRGLNFGRFSTTGWGEPRNQGYEYNWARSDAETEDMIATGQHTGLAAQVARGEVRIVYIYIGGNDFIHAMQSSDPMGRLEVVLPRALANYRLAVSTILDADPQVKLVLATLSDICNLPEFEGPIRSGQIAPAVANAYTAAIARFNAQVRTIAASSPRIALIDLDLTTRLANLMGTTRVHVGGLCLDRTHPRNEIESFFLADSRHPGTVGQSILAKLFIETINARFGAGVPALDNAEIISFAQDVANRATRELADLQTGPGQGAPHERTLVEAAIP